MLNVFLEDDNFNLCSMFNHSLSNRHLDGLIDYDYHQRHDEKTIKTYESSTYLPGSFVEPGSQAANTLATFSE